jgi:hypothetical protein
LRNGNRIFDCKVPCKVTVQYSGLNHPHLLQDPMSIARSLRDRTTSRPSPRGQALVEFAIILPLLAVLLVMAVDAGRLFFGWVALQNASRIGADYAASHADAWNGAPNPVELSQQARYSVLIKQDLTASGCQNIPAAAPPPIFDPSGTAPNDYADGVLVRVVLPCEFPLLTPLAQGFLGRPLFLHSSSEFAINRTIATGLGSGAPPPPGPTPAGCPSGQLMVPNLAGLKNQDAFAAWQGSGFTGSYSPAVTNGNKNKRVQSQSLPADSCRATSSGITVTLQ